MMPIDERLRSLGDHLDVDESSLVDDVLARLERDLEHDVEHDAAVSTEIGPAPGRVLRIVAAAVVLLVAVTVAVPSSRRTVAGWFGLDGATVERDVDLDVPAEPDPLDGRGAGATTVVGDREILVAAFVGTLDNPGLSKVLGDDSDISEVSVNGSPALWIDGAPHQVSYFDGDGAIVFDGFAGNTLLWQDGDLIRRVEGFDTVADAIAYAESLD